MRNRIPSLPESLDVNEISDRRRRFRGSTRAHDVDLIEDLKGSDKTDGDDERRYRLEQRHRDVAENPVAAGAVERGCLIRIRWDVLQTGEKDDHHRAGRRPDIQDHDRSATPGSARPARPRRRRSQLSKQQPITAVWIGEPDRFR